MSEPTPFNAFTAESGAVFIDEAGWLLPAHFGDPTGEYRMAHEGAVLFDVSHRGKVSVTGKDARSFLQNLSTNDIASLPVNAGREAFLANAKARAVAHLFIFHLLRDDHDVYMFDMAPGLSEKVVKHLDFFLISEQVELADQTREYGQLHLAGPRAAELLKKIFGDTPMELSPLQSSERFLPDGTTCQLRRNDILGVPGYDVLIPSAHAGSAWKALKTSGAIPAGQEAYHVLRIEAGSPFYGVDIDENNLVMETGRNAQAISYAKGCYLGQEPIVRARDLGQVNRSLLGLKIASEKTVPSGAKIFRNGKEVGHVTSSALSPWMESVVALAYIRRGNQESGTPVEVEAEGGRVSGEVVTLPFRK